MAPSHTILSNLRKTFNDFLALVPLEHRPRAGHLFKAELLPLVALHQQQRATELSLNAPATATNFEGVDAGGELTTNLEADDTVAKESSESETEAAALTSGDAAVTELAKAKSDVIEKELSKLVGMDGFKLRLNEWANGMLLDDNRRALGVKVARRKPPHMAFFGNSGTGKSSVARTLGELFHELGVLETNKVVEVQIADLMGPHMNQSSQKTRAKIEEAEGGILFIHEGHNLVSTKTSYYDFVKTEALQEIMLAMDNGKVVVIFAGNHEAMEHAVSSNEGLRRRLTVFFYFNDFTCEELAKILHVKLSNADENSTFYGYKLHTSCSVEAVAAIIENGANEKRRKAMNGRLVDQMLARAIENLDSRIGFECKDRDSLLTIISEDLAAALCPSNSRGIKRKRSEEDTCSNVKAKTDAPEPVAAKTDAPEPVAAKTDAPKPVEAKTDAPEIVEAKMDAKAKMEALEIELSKIVGMDALKVQLDKWLKGMIVDEKCATVGLDVGSRRLPHMVFLGNPGTGKTMVARVLAKLLHILGIISTNKVIEVQRTDLVGEYIGQTGPKTREKIEEAKGGILFVDEAYRLIPDLSNNDFGIEALEEIMSSMDSGDIVVIFAGYSEPMKRVISSNEGFKRRVSKVFNFDDYSSQDLAKILHLKMSNQVKTSPFYGFKLHPECTVEAIASLIERETTQEQRKELNGGLADQMLVNARENFDSRIDVESIDANLARTFTLEDLTVGIRDRVTGWLKEAATHFLSIYI